jgi:hypothetical protein
MEPRSRRTGALLALSLVPALALAGCAGSSGDGDSSSFFGSMFGGGDSAPKPAAGATAAVAQPADSIRDCPPVETNPGTGTLRLFEAGKDGDVMAVRYQATLSRMARECRGMGAEMAMSIGIEGRIIPGPKGSAGKVSIPLRFVVVDANNQPVFSQLRQITADVPSAQAPAEFSHVEQGILLPVDATNMRGWRALVGFDSSAAGKKS